MIHSRTFRFALFALVSVLVSGLVLGASVCVQASVPSKTAPGLSVEMTKAALDLPIEERMQELQDQGPQGYRNLIAIMKGDGFPVETRWRAVTGVARIGGDDSIPELEFAMAHKDWFMRNAGLIAAEAVDRGFALSWAKRLIVDKALVVRVAAVDVLDELHDTSSISLLWKKLNAKENYNGRQSLFIRRRIVEALSHLEMSGTEGKFITLLADKDETLYPTAMSALERLTGLRFGVTEHDSVPVRRARWQKWWRDKAKLRI